MVTILKVLGGILALLYGIYLGLGKGLEPTRDEIDEALDEKRTRRKVRRHFTFLDMFKKTREKSSDARRRSQKRKPFELD